jgi:glycolate oxidase
MELGGTLTGEHGIGMTKLKYVGKQLNQPAIRVTKGIKRVFDPQNILNPGKIVL